jgi:hypothetical protein
VKRSRGRGRRPQHNNGGGGGGGGGGHNPNRTFDSNGPEIKIRGSAAHVYEKYLQMARDANSAGDRVMAENYLQHAEHYYRMLAAAQAQQQQYQQQNPNAQQQGQPNQNQQNGNGQQRHPGQGEQPYVANGNVGGPSFNANEGEDADEAEDQAAQ